MEQPQTTGVRRCSRSVLNSSRNQISIHIPHPPISIYIPHYPILSPSLPPSPVPFLPPPPGAYFHFALACSMHNSLPLRSLAGGRFGLQRLLIKTYDGSQDPGPRARGPGPKAPRNRRLAPPEARGPSPSSGPRVHPGPGPSRPFLSCHVFSYLVLPSPLLACPALS